MIESIEREALELAAILDTMADGLFVIDPDHRIVRWNRGMERLTGYTLGEVAGRPCALLRPKDYGANRPHAVLDCDLFAEGAIDKVETTVLTRPGASVPVLANARVIRDPGGDPVGAVVTLTDISSLKALEGEVEALRRTVEGRAEFHDLVGKSAAMRAVFDLIELAAATPSTVLITGETGTGKELAARAIHFQSERRDGPLVRVNCAALSESLLESELFGHVRGAFTGAIRDHAGRFEKADGGTIFLDEIGDLPPMVQVKLLRVLQEREFERVGDTAVRRVDVRVIAATHRDLRQRVREGLLREDLFYRLNVFSLWLPPLRERKEDIELLVRRFIQTFNARTGKAVEGLMPDALRHVLDYPWPGNVRELENAIERAFITCSNGRIALDDLPAEVRQLNPPLAHPASPGRPGRRRAASRAAIEAALQAADWNKAEAARQLGMNRTSLWRRMRALGMALTPPD